MRIDGSNDWVNGFGGRRPTARPARSSTARDVAAPAAAVPAAASGPTAASPTPTPPIPAGPGQDDPSTPDQKAQHAADDPNLFHPHKDDSTAPSPGGRQQLTPDQEAEVVELQHRDAEVRAHEAAHAAAAGALGGGASFDYVTGPDGRTYAVGGEVPVEMAPGHTPEETIRNAEQLRAAALAPAQPSAQDRAVAAEASAMEAAARAEIAARSAAENSPQSAAAPLHSLGTPAAPATDRNAHAPPEVVSSDRDRVIQQLEVEQQSSRAGWRHLHSNDGCSACSQAVAAYR